jgi:hypothetical protein
VASTGCQLVSTTPVALRYCRSRDSMRNIKK